jgi:hypothetical protein
MQMPPKTAAAMMIFAWRGRQPHHHSAAAQRPQLLLHLACAVARAQFSGDFSAAKKSERVLELVGWVFLN